MPKPTAVWGLDIGQCALKALRLELIDGKPTATAFDYIEHPKILSQPDADPDALTREALDKFLSRNPLRNDLVALAVAGQSGLSRFVKLPPVEQSKIADIVKFEAKQQIPFPLDEVVWDFQTIAGGEVINNFAMETEIGLFAMKRETISKFLGQLNAVNIECHVVQMAPLALCNYATYETLGKGGPDAVDPANLEGADDTPKGKKRCAVMLDVGTDSSNLIITDGGKIIWQRPLPLGGNHFTRALTKEMKLTFAKAEHLKRNAAKSPDLGAILKALRPVLTDFVGEVQRSLGYFTNTHRDAHVAYMVGLGSAFRLPGLQKYMAEKLSLDVRKPAKFDRLAGDGVNNDPVFAENILSFPIAYGLALQAINLLGDRADYGRIRTNLLPKEIHIERQIRAKKPFAAACAAGFLLGTGILAAGYGVKHRAVHAAEIDAAAKTAETAIGSASNQTSAKSKGEGEVKALQDVVKAVIAGNEDRATLVRINEVVTAALPRPGQAGNLTDGTQVPLWSTQQGLDAAKAAELRIKQGVPADRANDDDLTRYLAAVNVEIIYPRYTDDLKAFMENADNRVWSTYQRQIAAFLLEDEREPETDETKKATKQFKPKGPDGGGWVVQVSGWTNHERGVDFLVKGMVRNFQKMGAFASETKKGVDPKTGQPVPDKVAALLPGASDPIEGRVSHVTLLNFKQVKNPQPKAYEIADKFELDSFFAAATGGAGGPSGGAAVDPGGSPADGNEGGVGRGAPGGAAGGVGGGWVRLGSGPAAGGGGFGGFGGFGPGGGLDLGSGFGLGLPGGGPPGGGPPGGGPPAVAPGAAKGAPPKERTEFVLIFCWRDTAAPAAVAADAPN